MIFVESSEKYQDKYMSLDDICLHLKSYPEETIKEAISVMKSNSFFDINNYETANEKYRISSVAQWMYKETGI